MYSSPEQALVTLLLSLFSADELRRFIRQGEDGAEVEAALPAPPASPASVADEAVKLLRARGDLNSTFFERLRAIRPRRTDEIGRVEGLFAPLLGIQPVLARSSGATPEAQLGLARVPGAQSPPRPLRILHLSDLHERAAFAGMPPEREALLELDAEERGYVLGPRLVETLLAIGERGVDLVCFTGDLADWGRPEEYVAATLRLEQILALIRVPKERFFAVPGNHDVRRDIHPEAWSGIRDWYARTRDTRSLGRWLRGADKAPAGVDAAWRSKLAERTAGFWDWMEAFGRGDLRPRGSKPLGYRHTIPSGTIQGLDQAIQIVGLDSAWLCGGRDDQGQILVTAEQARAHIRAGALPLDGFRVALMHHPLDHLADHHEVRRLLADDGVDLLLHGHQHVPIAMNSVEPGAELRILAAGCLMEGEVGMKWPNAFNLLEVPLDGSGVTVHFHKWSRDGSFWAPGSDLYRQAPGGVLRWGRFPSRLTLPASPGSPFPTPERTRVPPMTTAPPELIDVLAEEYPDVRDARSVWVRAGGRNGEVENISRPRDLWQNLWLRSVRGASVRPAALLKTVLEDLPHNGTLIAQLAALASPADSAAALRVVEWFEASGALDTANTLTLLAEWEVKDEADAFAAICPAMEGRLAPERRSELRDTLTAIGGELRKGALEGVVKAGTSEAVKVLLAALAATAAAH